MLDTRPLPRATVRPSGVLTWLVAVAPLWWELARRPELFGEPRVVGALVAGLAYGLGFVPWVRGGDRSAGRVVAVGLAQVTAGLVTAALVPFPLAGAPTSALLPIIALPQFVFVGRERLALVVIAVQTAGLAGIYHESMGRSVGSLLFTASALGFQLFAFAAARLAARESRARAELAVALDELSAAQAVLAAGERLGERVRIARDLHDAVGHHLTTLALHLDLARRQEPATARRTLDTAHAICRVLLAELRDVLADVRSADASDLTRALREIAARVPTVAVDVAVADDLGDLDPDVAQLALRAVQEAVTNALRHAAATRIAIEVERAEQGLVGRIQDDGRGIAGSQSGSGRAGSGLDGLRARLVARGGGLQVGAGRGGRGTLVSFSLPAAGRAPAGPGVPGGVAR